MQKVLECRPRLYWIVEIVFVNLSDRKQGIEAILAARIFLAQEAILINGATQNLVVVKPPSHLDHQFGRRYHARIRLRRRWRPEVHPPVRIDDPLVFLTSTLAEGTPVQRFAHALRFGELLTGPMVVVMDTSGSRNERKQCQ